jgi:hypothetical protein
LDRVNIPIALAPLGLVLQGVRLAVVGLLLIAGAAGLQVGVRAFFSQEGPETGLVHRDGDRAPLAQVLPGPRLAEWKTAQERNQRFLADIMASRRHPPIPAN